MLTSGIRACKLCDTAVIFKSFEIIETRVSKFSVILLAIFFCSMVHFLTPEVKETFADEAVVIVETTKYV